MLKKITNIGVILLSVFIGITCAAFFLEGENRIPILTWNKYFDSFGRDYIFWLSIRICVVLSGFISMVEISEGYTVYYLFRSNSIKRFYAKRVVSIVVNTFVYMLIMSGIEMLLSNNNSNANNLQLLAVIFRETFYMVDSILLAYFIFLIVKKAEISFLIVLAIEFLQGIVVGKQLSLTINFSISLALITFDYLLIRKRTYNLLTEIE